MAASSSWLIEERPLRQTVETAGVGEAFASPTSGDSLHMRGYRRGVEGVAPMKETLAASILALADEKVREALIAFRKAQTAEVLAQKPTGYNYDVCPGALPVCGLLEPAEADAGHGVRRAFLARVAQTDATVYLVRAARKAAQENPPPP